MKFKDIADTAEELRKDALALPDASMNNYRMIIGAYKQMFNDLVVLVRNTAQNLEHSDDA